ncbi:unnamed protein product [Arctogadus glacialis]
MESQNPNLTCIICFDTFRVPVTIPCGHTFCEKCITRHWDTQSKSDVPAQCPVCNKKFLDRPVLNRNVNLAVMTEAADSPSSAGGEPVSRDGGGATAILCHLHNMPLVYYCKQDKMGVCIKCGVSNCNSHQKVLLETERETQGLLLKSKSAEVEKLIKENDRSIGVLTENIEKAKVSLKQTSIWLDSKFCSLKEALDEKQETTNHFIERKNLGDLAQAEARLTQLRERAQELRQSQHRIEELHHLPDSELIKESTLVRVPSFKEFPVDMMPNLQERLNGITEVLSRVSKLVTEDLEKAVSAVVGQDKQGSPQDKRPVLAVVPSPAARCHPGGKEGLNAYRCSLTFDPRTANGHLLLSQENRRAEHLTSGPRQVLANEARFDHTWQVLCFQGFSSGQHYWELEVSKPWAYLGVTYEDIPRKEKGKRCMVGMNELSWSLQLDEQQLSAWHGGQREILPGHPRHKRLGLLLDYEAGTLTYYGDGATRLHAFHCAFTRTLFPACWIGEGVCVTLCST